jgi:hypothetical protein
MIVASVVSALAVDGWIEERGERRAEAEYRTLLRAEFEQSLHEVEADRLERSTILDRSQRLLDWAADPASSGLPPTLPLDSVSAWLGDLIDYRYYTPTPVVIEDLLASGSFGVLEDDELRRLILRLRQEEDRMQVVEERERDWIDAHLAPLIARELPLETIADRTADPAAVDRTLRRVFGETEVRSLVLVRIDRTDTSQRFSGGLARILEALTDSLASGAGS